MEQAEFKQNVYSYIKLLGAYLDNKELPDLSVDKSQLSFFYKLSKYHSLRAMLYQAVTATKAQVDPEQVKKLEEYYLTNVRKSALFDKERKELFNYLNEHEIDYLPLKGIILKDYYPDPYIREFADNDILFKGGDELIKEFFTKRDYEVELFKKSNHDVYLKKPFFNFEMHRALFAEMEDNEKFVSYYQNPFEITLVKEGHEHYLKDEDFYIYFTAHTYKHYRNSGCGIRTLVDYYLFLKKTNLDFDYINQELAKLDLLDFSNQMINLSKKAFEEEPLTNEEEEMLLYIASSGTYGTLEHSVEKGVKKKGKFGYTMSRLFPPYSFYKSAYPWAYKCPILIPIAWLCRFFRILFKNPKKATNELKMISKQKENK